MLAAIPFPDFDPVFIDLGFFQIRWYGMAYLGGMLLSWWYMLRLIADKYWPDGPPMARADVEDLILWCILGVVVGGRLGYVMFYQPSYYAANPGQILALWKGGMSFHGGLLGVTSAVIAFSVLRKKSLFAIADIVACATPIGLLLGRIANFINGELYGRTTDWDYGVKFPDGGAAPRHASQLYEAFLEGLVLFIILRWLFTRTKVRQRPGFLAGCFWVGYGSFRIVVEFFREPDSFLGFLWFGASMGQLLSIPVIMFGAFMIYHAQRNT